jgi:hypothetical protein|tara:strand:- start:1942 stop:2166 length:225 start_codon:yes stop_codon:yes gene_type:complete
MKGEAKKFLHSDELSEWDAIFDPGGKQEYTEEQLIRFAEIWASIQLNDKAGIKNDQYDGKTRTGGLSPDTGPRN